MVYLTMFWNVQSVQIKNSTFGLKKKKKKSVWILRTQLFSIKKCKKTHNQILKSTPIEKYMVRYQLYRLKRQ